jgi:hypothetical protein
MTKRDTNHIVGALQRRRGLIERYGRSKNSASRAEECPTMVGELDVPGRSVKQINTQLSLQLLDSLGKRGSGQMQFGGGSTEVQFLGDGHEVPDVAKAESIEHRRNRTAAVNSLMTNAVMMWRRLVVVFVDGVRHTGDQ